MRRFKRFGPFRYFPLKEVAGFSAWYKGYENAPYGFEWGYRDDMRGQDKPVIEIRVGKLVVLYFEKLKYGFELHVFGWWIIR